MERPAAIGAESDRAAVLTGAPSIWARIGPPAGLSTRSAGAHGNRRSSNAANAGARGCSGLAAVALGQRLHPCPVERPVPPLATPQLSRLSILDHPPGVDDQHPVRDLHGG